MPSNIRRIKAVCRLAVFRMYIMSVGMLICCIYWCFLFHIVLRAPITTYMTTTIIKNWYLLIFSRSLMALFWSPGMAKSIIWHSLFCLLIQTTSGNLYSIILSVWILKSQRILYLSFPWTYCGVWCMYLCVCVCVRACVFVPLATALSVVLLTQQPVHVGQNLVLAFSILTFNQNWTCIHKVY